MRLADFIVRNMETILGEWEEFAATLLRPSDELNSTILHLTTGGSFDPFRYERKLPLVPGVSVFGDELSVPVLTRLPSMF